MKRIVTILGARPQFIKAATISREIEKSQVFEEFIIHTGQHYDYTMSDLFFEQLRIPRPYKNLSVGSGSHGAQTGEMLKLIEEELQKLKPDILLVYGDTNSTIAGALAASKIHIPIAHVESGLRSFNRRMPEEINRVVTDHLAEYLFAPTIQAERNLINERISGDKIHLTGDVMYDAVLYYSAKEYESDIIDRLNLDKLNYILVTLHRAENTDNMQRLTELINELNIIGRQKQIIFPVHPRTANIIKQSSDFRTENIILIEPVGYLEMLQLQRSSRIIVTDSGGVQKEAFMNNKYCLTLRNETEWVELVESGYNFLISSVSELENHITMVWNKEFINKSFQPYGEGKSSQKIIEILSRTI